MSFTHFPPSDPVGAERLRAATVAWAPLLGALHAAGFRPYLELHRGGREDPLRLYCELEGDLLLDLSIEDEEIPDAPSDQIDGDWAVFVQDPDGNYLADVLIDPRSITARSRTSSANSSRPSAAANERCSCTGSPPGRSADRQSRALPRMESGSARV